MTYTLGNLYGINSKHVMKDIGPGILYMYQVVATYIR